MLFPLLRGSAATTSVLGAWAVAQFVLLFLLPLPAALIMLAARLLQGILTSLRVSVSPLTARIFMVTLPLVARGSLKGAASTPALLWGAGWGAQALAGAMLLRGRGGVSVAPMDDGGRARAMMQVYLLLRLGVLGQEVEEEEEEEGVEELPLQRSSEGVMSVQRTSSAGAAEDPSAAQQQTMPPQPRFGMPFGGPRSIHAPLLSAPLNIPSWEGHVPRPPPGRPPPALLQVARGAWPRGGRGPPGLGGMVLRGAGLRALLGGSSAPVAPAPKQY